MASILGTGAMAHAELAAQMTEKAIGFTAVTSTVYAVRPIRQLYGVPALLAVEDGQIPNHSRSNAETIGAPSVASAGKMAAGLENFKMMESVGHDRVIPDGAYI